MQKKLLFSFLLVSSSCIIPKQPMNHCSFTPFGNAIEYYEADSFQYMTTIDKLIYAIQTYDTNTIKNLLPTVDINQTDDDDWTPLYYAIESGSLKTVQLLVQAGADVNIQNKYGVTSLYLTFLIGLNFHSDCNQDKVVKIYTSIVQYLVDSGADVTLQYNQALDLEEVIYDKLPMTLLEIVLEVERYIAHEKKGWLYYLNLQNYEDSQNIKACDNLIHNCKTILQKK